MNVTFTYPEGVTAEDMNRYTEKVQSVMTNSVIKQMEKERNIYKHLICPHCKSKSCKVTLNKTDALLLDNGWGAYETLCECNDCGRDFRLSVSFEYKIKTSHTRLCDD